MDCRGWRRRRRSSGDGAGAEEAGSALKREARGRGAGEEAGDAGEAVKGSMVEPSTRAAARRREASVARGEAADNAGTAPD
jgi:hypothetical protein